jgi:hypothetical protein
MTRPRSTCEPIFTALAPTTASRTSDPRAPAITCEDGTTAPSTVFSRRTPRDTRFSTVQDFPKLDLEQIANASAARKRVALVAQRARGDGVSALTASSRRLKGWVADSGEGRWTVQEAIDIDVPAPVITPRCSRACARARRISFGAKVIAALRERVRRPRGGARMTTTASSAHAWRSSPRIRAQVQPHEQPRGRRAGTLTRAR